MPRCIGDSHLRLPLALLHKFFFRSAACLSLYRHQLRQDREQAGGPRLVEADHAAGGRHYGGYRRERNQIINESLQAAPRNYVLIGVRTKTVMGESGFRSAMAAMFQPKKPGQNLLRKAYINYYHRFKLNGMELPERTLKDIASRMRHTLEVARGSYRKINLAEEDDGLDVITTPTEAKATHPAVETMSGEHKATSANHKVVTPASSDRPEHREKNMG